MGSRPCGLPLSGREAGGAWVRGDRQVTRATACTAAHAAIAAVHPDPAHARTGASRWERSERRNDGGRPRVVRVGLTPLETTGY